MRIWRFEEPTDSECACFTVQSDSYAPRVEKWRDACAGCTRPFPIPERVQPIVIEWDPGSERVGDFSYGGGDILITEKVLHALCPRFKAFAAGPVKMIQAPKLRRPMRPTKRSQPRVWLPYEGPLLFELWVTVTVPCDRGKSTLKLSDHCPVCGFTFYQVLGTETIQSRWDQKRMELKTIHDRRKMGHGLFVEHSRLEGADIFRVAERDDWILCTDRVRDFIMEQGFTNVDFLEIGELI